MVRIILMRSQSLSTGGGRLVTGIEIMSISINTLVALCGMFV